MMPLSLNFGKNWVLVPKQKTAVQVKLPGLPQLGSNAEWYQGFAAGAGSMREACAAALISAGIEIIGETM